MPLKHCTQAADSRTMDAAQRDEILSRYREHSQRFQTVAARRAPTTEVVEFPPRQPELEHFPTAREIEVLQLVSEGLVNREIGDRLYLSEETVKSHVRHLLAKLQARSRAHAVAVGFRRGLLT
jgi:DNA-binding NarL/FixJ family response regulator